MPLLAGSALSRDSWTFEDPASPQPWLSDHRVKCGSASELRHAPPVAAGRAHPRQRGLAAYQVPLVRGRAVLR